MARPKDFVDDWRATWPAALRAWGRFITVRQPELCQSVAAAREQGLRDSFAAFLLDERKVVLDLVTVASQGLEDYALEVMAHEIGHHVLCPADLADHGKLLLRVRRGLAGRTEPAPLVANLYADLLINDRLQRSRGLRMDEVYRRLGANARSLLWTFYMRIYEHLWALPAGDLAGEVDDATLDGDARLAARLVRVYASDWLDGAAGFAALCARYLDEDDKKAMRQVSRRVCSGVLGEDAHIPGLAGADDGGEVLHPALDPRVNDFAEAEGDARNPDRSPPGELSGSQFREPFEYGQLLAQLGVRLDGRDAAIRYYRELALPHLVPFPVRRRPRATEPLPEGLEQWEISDPVESIDWLATTLRSPVVVPGTTTVQRWYGTSEGGDDDPLPVDLDLYVDSSGSMPNPSVRLSYLTLAGAILALSALRAGARVQVTLWSGTREFTHTDGFVRDERSVLSILTDHIGRATAFPLHMLRDTYLEGRSAGRPTHIVVISDDGVDTMITGVDERGTPGGDIARAALESAGAGGTLLLRLPHPGYRGRIAAITPGWDLHTVHDWTDLVHFAAEFSRRTYQRSPS
jgi:hypothetical protein